MQTISTLFGSYIFQLVTTRCLLCGGFLYTACLYFYSHPLVDEKPICRGILFMNDCQSQSNQQSEKLNSLMMTIRLHDLQI